MDARAATLDIRVVPLSRMAQGGRWRTEAMRSYQHPVLLWFARGQGRITVAGVSRGYAASNLIFLPTATMHGFDMVGSVQGHVMHLPNELRQFFPDEPLHLRLRDPAAQAEITRAIELIRREIDGAEFDAVDALRHHAGLLAIWLERQRRASGAALGEARNAADRLTAAFTSLIERDLKLAKGIAEYAADLGVTPTHLSRACRAASGRSASQILQDRVHFEARRLLSETDAPIKAISEELGFSSPAYFTRAFQSQTGLTPSAFRKNG